MYGPFDLIARLRTHLSLEVWTQFDDTSKSQSARPTERRRREVSHTVSTLVFPLERVRGLNSHLNGQRQNYFFYHHFGYSSARPFLEVPTLTTLCTLGSKWP